jgi:hypothetical protein
LTFDHKECKLKSTITSFEPSLGHKFKALGNKTKKNSLIFEVQSQRMKIKINFLPHLGQALGPDSKLSATRPIKNSLRFEIQSQRMKNKDQLFISFEPSIYLI